MLLYKNSGKRLLKVLETYEAWHFNQFKLLFHRGCRSEFSKPVFLYIIFILAGVRDNHTTKINNALSFFQSLLRITSCYEVLEYCLNEDERNGFVSWVAMMLRSFFAGKDIYHTSEIVILQNNINLPRRALHTSQSF